jgi:hypothetical protein
LVVVFFIPNPIADFAKVIANLQVCYLVMPSAEKNLFFQLIQDFTSFRMTKIPFSTACYLLAFSGSTGFQLCRGTDRMNVLPGEGATELHKPKTFYQ